MGFGFVVARFGLFLHEFQGAQHTLSAPSYGLSLWFGTAFIAVGVLVQVFAGWHDTRLVREWDRGAATHMRPATQAVAMAVFLALVGLAMALYLISVRSSTRAQSAHSEETSRTPRRGNAIIDIPS